MSALGLVTLCEKSYSEPVPTKHFVPKHMVRDTLVVFIPGAETGLAFHKIAEQLSYKSIECVVLDPGFGEGREVYQSLTTQKMLEKITRELKQYGQGRHVIICAQSYGAVLAALLTSSSSLEEFEIDVLSQIWLNPSFSLRHPLVGFIMWLAAFLSSSDFGKRLIKNHAGFITAVLTKLLWFQFPDEVPVDYFNKLSRKAERKYGNEHEEKMICDHVVPASLPRAVVADMIVGAMLSLPLLHEMCASVEIYWGVYDGLVRPLVRLRKLLGRCYREDYFLKAGHLIANVRADVVIRALIAKLNS